MSETTKEQPCDHHLADIFAGLAARTTCPNCKKQICWHFKSGSFREISEEYLKTHTYAEFQEAP